MAITRDQVQALRCVAAVGSAYLVQGIVAAVGVLLLGALADAGTPIEQQAGLLAGAAVPWVLKCAVAVVFDVARSWPLRLRAAVLAGLQLCAAACLWSLAAAWAERDAGGVDSLRAIAIAWITLNFIASLQDVVTDNLALDTLRGRQAWTATAMGLGHAVGMGIGSMVLGTALGKSGMVAALRMPATWVAILALICGALVWMPGRPARAHEATARAEAATVREGLLSGPQLRALAGVLLLFAALMLGSNLTQAIAPEFLFGHLHGELQLDLAEASRLLPPIGAIAGIAGALAMGPLIARLDPARASMLAGGALGVVWLSFASVSAWWSAPAMLPTFAGFEGVLQSALMVGLHAIALIAAARSPLPTTAFVLAMAALNLPRALAPLMSPTIVEFGWVGVFVACGAIQLIAVAGLWPLRKWMPSR